LYDKDGNKRSLADFRKASAQTLKNFNTTYFNVECEAAFAQADTAMKWKGFLEDADVYPNLQYVTAHDERVRDSHRVLHNIIRPVNDPFWRTHTPPLGYRCRCVIIQTDEAATGIPHELPKSPAGFGHNPGETGEVFSQEHPYFKVGKTNKAELDKVAAKLEYNNFYPSQDFEKTKFDHNLGGYIVQHKKHGEDELAENMEVARDLYQMGKRIILLPIVQVQGRISPDTLENELYSEYKVLQSPNALKSIQRNIEGVGEKEVEKAVLRLPKEHKFDDVIKAIGFALQKDRNKSVQFLTIILPNDRVVELKRSDVVNRSFIEIIKKEWNKP
jgi:SPP1 gp7 family putative phage head morphogenesis protein